MDRPRTRRDKLRKQLRKAGAAAMLVTNFPNVTYLTGFSGDDSFLLIWREGEVLISDSRYTLQIEEECPGLEAHIRKNTVVMSDAAARVVKSAGVESLAIESGTMTVSLRDELATKSPAVELISTTGIVEELRKVKDKDEVAAIRVAVAQAEKAFGLLQASFGREQTEKELNDDLESYLRRFGAVRSSFPPIVAVGPRAALPHAAPTCRQVAASDFVLVDWGALSGGYVSDLTRVLVTGKISPKLERVYRVVLKANRQAIAAIRPGVTCREVDRVARGVIEKAGFGKFFGHGLGHGIGLEVHEAPRLSAKNEEPLKPGMVVTIEPGIYLPDWGGVRIEDDVLVTRSGHEVLSTLSKDLDDMIVA